MTESFEKAVKSFNEADEKFQELMKKVNNKLVTTDGQILLDSDYNKEVKEIAKEASRIAKEIADNVALELRKIESKDNIKSPNHYVSESGIEVFDVQEAFIHELKGMAASYWCNVVKYILRFQRKNGVEDLKKAKYYLEKLIDEEE